MIGRAITVLSRGHFLARFRRRTKVVSKVVEMVDLSLRIYHHFHDNLDAFAEKPRFSGLSLVRTLRINIDFAAPGMDSVEREAKANQFRSTS